VQFFKRSPVNFRKLFGIKPKENPQALAVFLKAYCLLYRKEGKKEDLESIEYLSERIIANIKPGWAGACWSYPFAWQARAFYQPQDTPLIIPTAYCSNALLDAYAITGQEELKNQACSTAQFILSDLNRTYEDDLFAFSYSPNDNSVVYNASLMASQVLSRIYALTKEPSLKEEAKKSVLYCLNKQKNNGSWAYGDADFHQWVDNFHTGYNLVCLNDYMNYCQDQSILQQVEHGLAYYLKNFFDKSGFSKYYSNKSYPLDVNNPAQLIITLNAFNKVEDHLDLVNRVIGYTINKMQSNAGWFYYQKSKIYSNKIIYLRWSNAWMFNALALLVQNDE
jgi:hypothetical protein